MGKKKQSGKKYQAPWRLEAQAGFQQQVENTYLKEQARLKMEDIENKCLKKKTFLLNDAKFRRFFFD